MESPKERIVRRNFQYSDISYENGFPANIDMNSKFVVQITERPYQSVILYKCKIKNKSTRSFLPFEHGEKYNPGLYIF